MEENQLDERDVKIKKLAKILKAILSQLSIYRSRQSLFQTANKITKELHVEKNRELNDKLINILSKHFTYGIKGADYNSIAEEIVNMIETFEGPTRYRPSGGGGTPPTDPPDYLWDLMKKETEQLWQRSIMLLSLFAGVFTAYGQIILPILNTVQEAHKLQQSHFFGALIALVGIIFSLIWIAIGKGANYWYNKYYSVLEYNYQKNNKINEISYFNLPPIIVNDCLLSRSPGRYSISRSQIAIGQVIFFIWSIVFITHCVQFTINGGLDWLSKCWDLNNWKSTSVGFIASIIILKELFCLVNHFLKFEWDKDIEDKNLKKIINKKPNNTSEEEKDYTNKIKEIVELIQKDINQHTDSDTEIQKIAEFLKPIIPPALSIEELNQWVEYLYNKYFKK